MTVSQPPIQSTLSWEDFVAGLQRRFILPVHEFEYRVSFVPIFLQPEQRTAIVNLVREVVVDALRLEPECALSALKVRINPKLDMGSNPEEEEEYFSITFGHPVFDFAVQLGPKTFRILKLRSTLPNLLHTVRLFSRITTRLFPPINAETAETLNFHTAGITPHVHLVNFRWQHEVVLGQKLGTDEDANNLDLLRKLIRLDASPSGAPSRDAPLASLLEVDAIRRGDVSIGFNRIMGDRRRQMWINYVGPYNVTRKDVDLDFSYRMGEPGVDLEEIDLRDFRTPFMDFYHDLILGQFFGDLFSDVDVSGRL